jgi:hypothetical protein
MNGRGSIVLRQNAPSLSGGGPVEIVADMDSMIDFLIRVSEEMLIHLVIYSGRERFTFNVQETADDQMDREFPIKCKLLAFLKPFQKPGKPIPEPARSENQ